VSSFWSAPYRAPAIPARLVLTLVLAFAGLTWIRGATLTFDSSASMGESDVVMSALANMQVWGLFLMGAATFLILSILFVRLKMVVWSGHVLLCALYFCISITVAQSIYHFGGDGPQALIPPLGSCLWHVIFVFMLRPSSRKERE